MISGRSSIEPASFLRYILYVFVVLLTVTISRAGEPLQVSVCQLKKDPPAYNHKLVEVTGFVTHAARNFTIYDPTCPSWPAIWLEYGGSINSGTVACCKSLSDRHRSQPLIIENIPLPLTDNQLFEDFDKAVQPPFRAGQAGAVAHATLIGTFFAGQQMETATEHYWGGYGYMGCCSLLAIQEVKDADTQRRADLDYGESNEKLDLPDPDCTLRMLLPDEQNAALIQAQRGADNGSRGWAFTDPSQVAADALARLVKKKATGSDLKLARDSASRKAYQWTSKNKSYTIVVSRPYWLSYYARDSKQVAWVAVAAYETSCTASRDTD